jgi:hypothetical protein
VAKQQDASHGGFREFVKDPSIRKSAERAERRERQRLPPGIDEVPALLARLLTDDDPERARSRLRAAGEAAVPALVAALADPRFRRARYQHNLTETAWEVVLDLLQPFAPAAAVEHLAPLVEHRQSYFRKHAALALGNIANDDCVMPLAGALADRDDYVRSYALMGMQYATEAGRAAPRFRRVMFPPVAALVHATGLKNYNTAEEAPRCLLGLDRDCAARLLLGRTCLRIDHPNLDRILQALNGAEVPVPARRLLRLLDEFFAADKVDDGACAAALAALPRSDAPGAEQVLHEARARWPDSQAADAASEALAALHGVADPTGFVLDRLDEAGFSGLSRQQKMYYCAWLLNAEVRNGGFAQYFVNSSGNQARTALEGLETIGAPRAAAVLERAMQLFGVAGPARGRDRRHGQLAEMSPGQDAEMEDIDDAYYQQAENLDALLLQYAMLHRDHFGAGAG